jgi:hypothetical protein
VGETLFRLYLKLVFPFILMFAALNMAAPAFGNMQPTNPGLVGFSVDCEGKQQPCWYGIVPGETTADEQRDLMRTNHYAPVQEGRLVASYRSAGHSPQNCQRVTFLRTQDGVGEVIVHEIILSECPTMKSGHVMGMFLRPSLLSSVTPILFYENGSVSAIFTASSRWNLSSFEPIENLRLRAPKRLPMQHWHGFLPTWRYCQLEPSAPGCK